MSALRYLDVCAGISASTVAWKSLGWTAAAYSEIEAAPRAILAHHYPDTPLHGDFTTIRGDEYGAIDLLVGGTPCQDFSVAGLRAGLDGDRGNLSLEFLRLADRARPRWVVWENVPGVLSIDGGRAFGAILGGLGKLGYGFAYRVLDAQFFGVPQRRRRVFIIGCAGDWRGAAAVLSERYSLSGHPAPVRRPGEVVAAFTANGVGTCGADDNQAQAGHIIAFSAKDQGADALLDCSPTIRAGGHAKSHANAGVMPAVVRGDDDPRKMTPCEVERCFGFPDDYTLVPHRGKPMADGPRYKALGNSMAVPVMRWIGERIAKVEQLSGERIAA